MPKRGLRALLPTQMAMAQLMKARGLRALWLKAVTLLMKARRFRALVVKAVMPASGRRARLVKKLSRRRSAQARRPEERKASRPEEFPNVEG